jgi:hypothetical protein
MEHLLLSYVYCWELWFKLLWSSGWHHLAASYNSRFPNWWLITHKRLHKDLHHGFNMFGILVSSTGSAVYQGPRNSLKLRRLPTACFFVWVALLDRCWTFARLQCHNLQNSGFYALCSHSSETMEHLLLSCVYSRELWFKLLRSSGWHHLALSYDSTFPNWWLLTCKRLHKELHCGFGMFIILVSSNGSVVSLGTMTRSPNTMRGTRVTEAVMITRDAASARRNYAKSIRKHCARCTFPVAFLRAKQRHHVRRQN